VKNVADALQRAAMVATILLVEQNFGVASRLVGDAIVLDQGRVVFRGTIATLSADPELARQHLGLATAGHA
jgi:branched-chain amino acid transport system ATP-binding protein